MSVSGVSFTLYVPDSWQPTAKVNLTLHFHGAVWHALQEHIDRGAKEPVLAFALGEGSTVYRTPFVKPETLGSVISETLKELKKLSNQPIQLDKLNLTSFSAGYGAIREIVQQPWLEKVNRVILSDSLYGSLDPEKPERTVLSAHVDCWKPLRDAAIRGEKTFCLTVSDVPTPTYASSFEVASALFLGQWSPVEKGTLSATLDRQFPLLRRYDSGNFHVWSYGGADGAAHLTHVRHMASVWKALDLAGRP